MPVSVPAAAGTVRGGSWLRWCYLQSPHGACLLSLRRCNLQARVSLGTPEQPTAAAQSPQRCWLRWSTLCGALTLPLF